MRNHASRLVDLLFRPTRATDVRKRRMAGLVQGVATSFGSKLVGVLVSFLSVPLTIGYLGTERYGAWISIGSLLAWLSLTDFGLGNGLNTAVATAFGQDRPDLMRMHVSNGFFMLCAVAAAAGLVAVLAWPFIDWSALYGLTSPVARGEIGPAMALVLTIFLLQFPTSVAGRVYLATQEGRIANYWGIAGNVLSLLALLVVVHGEGGLVSLVLAISGSWLLLNVASTVWLFGRHRPDLAPSLRCVDGRALRSLGNMGGKFFLIQVMGLVTFQSDVLVVGHFLGAQVVPTYSLTYNLFAYTTLPHSLLFSYLWSAYSEAIARGDIDWVKRTFHVSVAGGMAFAAAGVAVLVVIARPFITWWSAGHVTPPAGLVAWMGAWSLVNAFTIPMGCLLAAAAHLRAQTAYSAVATACNLALSIWLVQSWGVTGVIAGTVASYAVFICGPILFDAEFLLRRLRRHAAGIPA